MQFFARNEADVTILQPGDTENVPLKRRGNGSRMHAWAEHVKTAFRKWREVRRSRRALNRLTETELRDIGLTRTQARAEYRRSLFID